jgi:hypothetical protein
MSKMEEKLKASIKPREPARSKLQPSAGSPRKAVAQDADLNMPNAPVHPQRIWPE